MVWARIEDDFTDHPKVAGLSDRAFRIHVTALCYANRYLTDGHVPSTMLTTRQHLSPKVAHAVAAELTKAGLWEPNGTGWLIHDWQDYNPTADEVRQRRKVNAERQRRWRRGPDGRFKGQEGPQEPPEDGT